MRLKIRIDDRKQLVIVGVQICTPLPCERAALISKESNIKETNSYLIHLVIWITSISYQHLLVLVLGMPKDYNSDGLRESHWDYNLTYAWSKSKHANNDGVVGEGINFLMFILIFFICVKFELSSVGC